LATTALTPAHIEELLTNFLNSELAAKRPKIDLLGSGIVEPESLIFPPLSKEQIEDAKKAFTTTATSLQPENIKPEDMVSGEWYWLKYSDEDIYWIFKYEHHDDNNFWTIYTVTSVGRFIGDLGYLPIGNIETIRKATREEVTKYFPNEFDIPKVTDEQL